MTRRILICSATAVLLSAALLTAADTLHIVPITHDNEVLVTVDFPDAFTPDVRDAIASGLRTTVSYDVELRMHASLWLDRTVATAVVSTSDQYENLTRRHTLMRSVDGRVEETLVTEDENVVRRWFTTLSRLPLCGTSKLEASRDYYVRIRARVRPNRASLLGVAEAVVGQAKFTFIP